VSVLSRSNMRKRRSSLASWAGSAFDPISDVTQINNNSWSNINKNVLRSLSWWYEHYNLASFEKMAVVIIGTKTCLEFSVQRFTPRNVFDSMNFDFNKDYKVQQSNICWLFVIRNEVYLSMETTTLAICFGNL